MKPNATNIANQARDLAKKFAKRDLELKEREELRYGVYKIEIPEAYKSTAEEYKSPILREEGRAIMALIKADPVPHVPPPTPEDQDRTTTMEKWAAAAIQELEAHYGSINNQCTSAQIHQKIGWMYLGMRRAYYKGAPKETGDVLEDALKMDAYKRAAGISEVFEQRFVPTDTAYWTGKIWNPTRFYEVKYVDSLDLIAEYNLVEREDGTFAKPSLDTVISGTSDPNQKGSRKIKFIEYWDRNWCVLLCEQPLPGWDNTRQSEVLELDSWEHNWGRVPYFPRPAFESDQTDDEHRRFESPLDGLYTEIKTYNRVRTILSSVAFMTGFAPLKVVTKEGNQPIIDANGNMKTVLEFEPGKPTQLAPGQDLLPVVVSPEAQILQNEVAASERRVSQYSLSEIARGVSPGADTANSALSQLRRQQKSSLQTLNQNQARQYREMLIFMFKRLIGQEGKGIGTTVYVFSPETKDVVGCGPDDIVTMNIQVICDADQGQDKLIEEKAALEAFLQGAITELEYHMRRGKENPEEYVKATALDRLRRSFEPELFQGIKALFQQSSALAQLVAQNRENGNAADAIPGILNTMQGIQNGQPPTPSAFGAPNMAGPTPAGEAYQGNGLGEGSPMMPRTESVRSPALQQTTQPGLG